MDKTEKTITFDNLLQAVATLLQGVRELRTLTENHATYGGFSPWMDVDELGEYLPRHPGAGHWRCRMRKVNLAVRCALRDSRRHRASRHRLFRRRPSTPFR